MDKLKKNVKVNGLFIAGAILVVLYLFSEIWFGEYKLSNTNLLYQSEPWNSYGVEVGGPLLSDSVDSLLPSVYGLYQNGSIGLWNNDLALGAEEEISYLMYPLYYLFALPLEFAIILRSIVKFLIGFTGMYFLCREYKVNRLISSFAGIAYTFSSFIVMWHFWPHSDVAILFPLVFVFAKRMVEKAKVRDMLFVAVFMYLMLVAGMPTVAAYAIYLLGAYILTMTLVTHWRDWKVILRVYGLFVISVVFAALLSSPYTISLVASVGGNGYSESRANQALAIFNWKYLRTAIFPYIRTELSAHINEATIFIGIPALFALIFTPIRLRDKKGIKFWTISAIVLILLLFTHVFDFIFVRMPAINTSLRYRLVSLLVFVTPIISAINIQDIFANKEIYRKLLKFYVPVAAVLLGVFYYWGRAYKAEDGIFINTLYILIITAVLFGLLFYFKSKVVLVALIVVCVISSGGFVKDYLPMISKDADIIPEATDTIEYLQENTADGERIYPIGAWTLFGNSNVYYGLNSINTHNFVNTNADMQKYLTIIDDNFYTTPTRTAAQDVENVNLLKYMGVKYIVGSQNDVGFQSSPGSGIVPIGDLLDTVEVTQDFKCDRDGFSMFKIMLGTYATVYDDESMRVSLTNLDTGELIIEEIIKLSEVKDNDFIVIDFDIQESDNVTYRLSITTDVQEEKQLTVYGSGGQSYPGDLYYNGELVAGSDIFMQTFYSVVDYIEGEAVFTGNDGMKVIELDSYSDKVELIEDVKVGTEDEVLNSMASEYLEDTLYITGDSQSTVYSYSDEPLSDSEKAEIVEYTDDYIKVNVNIEQDRFLLLNDYYDEDWKVYIDGEEAVLDKANYLMRAVYIPDEGEHIVEFRYSPQRINILIYTSMATAVVVLLLFIFSGVIDKRFAVKHTNAETLKENKGGNN